MKDTSHINLIEATDSYKLTHFGQYPKGTQIVYSYMEARPGAHWNEIQWFGTQYLLDRYLTQTVTQQDIEEAEELAALHFRRPGLFNREGWQHIVDEHGGKLPLCIKSVQEGTVVPIHNALMTVENTCDKCWWLTNAMESLLTHNWYPATVATLSRATLQNIGGALAMSADNTDGLRFMLHDFGFRGASSYETACVGGMAHLVNSRGTDTVSALRKAKDYYDADLATLGFSIPATEHSVMTALGEDGEDEVIEQLLKTYPEGLLSIVGDSYNIYRFVDLLCTKYHDQILARDGKIVVRPDSTTPDHKTPELEVAWILDRLWDGFGGHVNSKGYRVVDEHVGVLWGDGIDPAGIDRILREVRFTSQGGHDYSVECLAFGMGGGLLQKVNRDTMRFAFKASAMKRDGTWHQVFKNPLDASKASMKGRLMLLKDEEHGYRTVAQHHGADDQLKVVFFNGEIRNRTTFDEVRERAGDLIASEAVVA